MAFGFRLYRGLSSFGSAGQAVIKYLLNALGFATKGSQTLSAPFVTLASDWEGTLQDFGGVVNSDGVAVAAVPGSRLSGGVVYDDDGSGNDLHPYAIKSGVRDYLFYAPHATSTAYAVGDKVWAEASDGIRRWYYIDTGDDGTSGGSPPTFPTSGTVVDGTATWTYGGKYTLRGQKIEGSLTNKCTCVKANPLNKDDNVVYTGGATGLIVDDSTALGVAKLDGVCLGDVYEFTLPTGGIATFSGVVGNTNPHSTQAFARAVSGEAEIGLGGSTRNDVTTSAYVEFIQSGITPTSTIKELLVYNPNVTTAVIRVILPGLYESSFAPDAPIVDPDNDTATTVTRSAVNMPIPTAGILRSQNCAVQGIVEPLAAGQLDKYIFSTYIDSSNYTGVYNRSTDKVSMIRRDSGVYSTAESAYAAVAGKQFQYQAYWSDAGMGIRVREIGGTWSAWAVHATASAAQIAAAAQIGARADTAHFHGNYPQFKTLFLPPKASAADYQSYIEDEENWQ